MQRTLQCDSAELVGRVKHGQKRPSFAGGSDDRGGYPDLAFECMACAQMVKATSASSTLLPAECSRCSRFLPIPSSRLFRPVLANVSRSLLHPGPHSALLCLGVTRESLTVLQSTAIPALPSYEQAGVRAQRSPDLIDREIQP